MLNKQIHLIIYKNLALFLVLIGFLAAIGFFYSGAQKYLVLSFGVVLVIIGSVIYFINQIFNTIRFVVTEQARLETSLNSLNIGFLIFDEKLKIKSVNSAAKRMIFPDELNSSSSAIIHSDKWVEGGSSQEPSKNTDPAFEWDVIRQKLLKVVDIEQNLKTSLAEKKTIRIDRLSYNNLYLKIFISPLIKFDHNFENIGLVVLIEDITERELMEKSKDDFFSIASHELRTPLTTIRGNTSLIIDYYGDKITDPDLKQMVEDIHESSVRLIDLVNDFLDTSRLEQGRINFVCEEFNLADLAAQVIRDLVPLTKEKNILLKNEITTNSGTVYADKNRVKQILTNLISNGIKFTEVGEVRLYSDPQQNSLKILIQDSGRGIPEHDQNLLFRKFQQASDNPLIRDSKRSTGLGLYISKLMVEGMGGEIKLESSEQGKGSVFSFTLPRSK